MRGAAIWAERLSSLLGRRPAGPIFGRAPECQTKMPPRKRTIDDSQAGDGQASAAAPALPTRRGGGVGVGGGSGGKDNASAPPAPAASAAPDDAPLKLKMVQVETSGDDSARWNGAFASFAADLRASAEMSDVTVVSKGGEKTPAHRWVLAARSEMLRAKLGNPGFPEGREGLVPMDEDNAVVQCLLDYMYSGQVSMSVDMALDVLMAAATYQVSDRERERESRGENAAIA